MSDVLTFASAILLLALSLACVGCASSGQSSAGNEAGRSSSAASVPPAFSPKTTVAFKLADDKSVSIHLGTVLENDGDDDRRVTYRGAFLFLNAAGEAVGSQPVRGSCFVSAQHDCAIKTGAPIDRALVDGIATTKLLCQYECGDGFHIFNQEKPQSAATAKEALQNEEAARAEQERLDAWWARFPVGDYSNTLLIGDSIMQNAQNSLWAALPGVTVNADAGRTLEEGGMVFENQSPELGVLDHVRKDAGYYERYVIGTGNNNPEGMSVEAAEEIIACLGEGKEIYFVTEAMRSESTSVAVTNATIADVVARYPNVHAIDWHGLVAGHEYDYLADAVHPYRSREPDYANCIKQGLDTPYPR